MKRNIILLASIIISGTAFSQVGIDNDTPKATLDIKASPTNATKIDGLIAPRLTGDELKGNDAKYTTEQDAAIVYVTAATTAPQTNKTTNVTSIGYYYFDKTQGTEGQWMKIANPEKAIIYQEPWNIQGTTNPSTTNTDAIYQNNTVAVKKQTGIAGADLDILGAIRGGGAKVDTPVGTNSIAVGPDSAATGVNSIAFGNNNTASGESSFATGKNNNVSAFGGSTLGDSNIATGTTSFAAGTSNEVKGNFSFAGGLKNKIGDGISTNTGYASTVFGDSNTVNNLLSLVNGYGNVLTQSAAGTNFVSGDQNKIPNNASWNGIIGRFNQTDANISFISGSNNLVKSNGGLSAVIGEFNTLDGGYSFVTGRYNIATRPYNAVFGRYNLDFSKAYFTIGNGASTTRNNVNVIRSNAFVVVDENTANDLTPAKTWVAIGSNTSIPTRSDETIQLKVYGGIETSTTTYPDYVFEDYFNGNSLLNSNYKFNTLYNVESFIKNNHHLPGVTSVKNLEKTENGYTVNLSELSTQTLEKVEELYLHTIEQQKLIDAQQKQINLLIKTVENLQSKK